MFRSGFVQVATLRGTPIRVHWSVVLLCLFAGGWGFRPGAWIGVAAVILLHELGHAALAWRFRLRVREVMLHGFGGHCGYSGNPSPIERSIVASGGVLVQLLLVGAAYALYALLGVTSLKFTDFIEDFFYALIYTNLMIALLNLLPFPGLDGEEIWKLPRLLRERRRRHGLSVPSARRRVDPPRSSSSAGSRSSPLATDVDEDAIQETVARALAEARKKSGPPPS